MLDPRRNHHHSPLTKPNATQRNREDKRDGQIRAEVRVDAIRRALGGKLTSLPRGDLAAAIFSTIENDVETIFSDSILAVDDRPNGVRLTFANTPERAFDLLVGADRLHSNVRRLTFGPDAQFERHLGCRVAAFVVEGYHPRDAYVTHNNLPGRQIGRFALRGNRTMFLFVFRSEHDSDVDDAAAAKTRRRREFGDAGWECPRILAALDDASDFYSDAVSQIRMPCWSRGRVLLIGDAAGCVSFLAGEGTGLAMAEAYVLAGELARARGGHREAFDARLPKQSLYTAAELDVWTGTVGPASNDPVTGRSV